MARIAELRNGKWSHQKATAQEVREKIAEITSYVDKYGWGQREVYPYRHSITVSELLEKDYEGCSVSSWSICLTTLNGFIQTINEWIEIEAEDKVTVRLISGKNKGQLRVVTATEAEDYVDLGMGEIV